MHYFIVVEDELREPAFFLGESIEPELDLGGDLVLPLRLQNRPIGFDVGSPELLGEQNEKDPRC